MSLAGAKRTRRSKSGSPTDNISSSQAVSRRKNKNNDSDVSKSLSHWPNYFDQVREGSAFTLPLMLTDLLHLVVISGLFRIVA